MKKNKHLIRCYIGGYFLWLFGAILFPLLMIKFSGALAAVLFALSCVILGGLIASHVLYNVKRELYSIFSFVFHGLNCAFIFAGLIVEIIFAASGEGATYALIMLPVCAAFEALLMYFLIKSNLTVMKKLALKKEEDAKIQAKLEEEKAVKEAEETQENL